MLALLVSAMTKAEVDETYFAVEDGKWTYRVYGNGMAGIAGWKGVLAVLTHRFIRILLQSAASTKISE